MIALVTGATDGIGKETARKLAARGFDVVVHGRTQEKAERARAEVDAKRAVAAELSSLDAVRALAGQIEALDVLVNNAGVYMKRRALTADGREMSMAVNHDAPFLLTHLLLARLRASKDPRVVNVSSVAHTRGRIDVDDIDMARGFSAYGAYAASKLANVLFTVELARRAPGVKVNACHPGVVSTKLLKAGFDMNGPDSLDEGARTSVLLAAGDVDDSGAYWVAERRARASIDERLCAPFYEASARRVGVAPLRAP